MEDGMANDNEDLVRKGYEAFGQGAMDTLARLMADDVVHTFPGDSQVSGEHKGRDAAFALYGKLFELSGGTFKADLKSATARGDDTVVAKHGHSATRDGKTIDVEETLTFTIEDGQMTRLESSFEPGDQAAVDDFWA
jgi:ketosteroid isomerase-like protein